MVHLTIIIQRFTVVTKKSLQEKSKSRVCGMLMAPGVGIEPTAKGLTVLCSTAELPRNRAWLTLTKTNGRHIIANKKTSVKPQLGKKKWPVTAKEEGLG